MKYGTILESGRKQFNRIDFVLILYGRLTHGRL